MQTHLRGAQQMNHYMMQTIQFLIFSNSMHDKLIKQHLR